MTTSTLTRPVCLQVRGVSKRFGATLALSDVSFEVQRGEVHALLGHNGSGKSTLVKIINGLVAPDQGDATAVAPDGRTPRVGIVHQDLGLCDEATVLENCGLSGYRVRAGRFIDWASERRMIEPILASLDADIDPDVMVGRLSPADQAVVAVVRALREASGSGGLDLLVLDEATARLRGRDADRLLETARRVAGRGGGVLLVTHHMSEVLHAADRATVLMNGRVSGSVDVAGLDEETLVEMVSGRRVARVSAQQRQQGSAAARGERLRASGLTGSVLRDVHLSAHGGEILGVTGPADAGHDELPYLLSGAVRARGGSLHLDGRDVGGTDLPRRRRRGIGLVPADRRTQGVLGEASVRENLSPLVRGAHVRLRLCAFGRERRWADDVCSQFDVVPRDTELLVGTLSGGNQQKVLLARVMEDRPQVLILHEPTQGVDEGTRRSLMALVRRAADDGAAVVYVSSDIEEVAEVSDRVLVVRDGRLVDEVAGGPEHADDVYGACYLNTFSNEALADDGAVRGGTR